jgi:hypothetical protein
MTSVELCIILHVRAGLGNTCGDLWHRIFYIEIEDLVQTFKFNFIKTYSTNPKAPIYYIWFNSAFASLKIYGFYISSWKYVKKASQIQIFRISESLVDFIKI